jgi:iron complex outermembrane receptor protein
MQAFLKAFRVAVFLLAPSALTAQASAVVSGRVVDAADSAGLAAVTVRLVELHRETRSGDEGRFSLGVVPEGVYQLTVQRLGYQSQSVVLIVRENLAPIVIAMRASPMQMHATVVTGQVSERGAADAISPTTSLSEAALDRRLDGNLGTTVAGTPGVAVVSMGPATAKPVVRGLSGDRVLILEDGLRTGDLASTGSDHAVAVDPLTAQRIEIVRGPMSLLYGSSALGGVVNVIREEVPTTPIETMHGTFSAQASGVNDGLTVGGVLESPLGGFAVRAELSGRMAGDMRTPVGRMNNTGIAMLGGSVGASRLSDWGHTGISYRYFGNDYGLPGGFVGAHPNGVDIAMRRHMVRSETEVHPAAGRFESIKAHLSVSDYLHDELEGDGDVATRFHQVMTAGELIARHRHTGVSSGGVIGLRGQYRDITTAGALRTPSTADWSAAAFVVEEFGSGPLRGQAGLRYDLARFIPLEETDVVVQDDTIPAAPRTFGALSGSLGALYRFENGMRVGASVSRAYRTPDFNELYSDGPHLAAYSYDVGNPRIKQETGIGTDVFVRLERDRVHAEVAVFANQMRGFIFPRNTGELGAQGQRWKFQYTNEDAALVGAEAEIEWRIREHVVFEVTASHVLGTIEGDRDTIPGIDGEPDRVESQYLPLMPPLNGRLGFRHETPTWFYGAGVKLAAAQTRLGDFETRTDGYATADLILGYRLLVGSRLHAFTLRVDNALDAEIREHLARTKEILPGAGRNISLLYRLQF